MSKQVSFSKFENKVLPGFRHKISHAESTEDVKKFFVYTIKDLFDEVFRASIKFEYDDVKLDAEQENGFDLSRRIMDMKDFSAVWNGSDLRRVVTRIAETSAHRCKHLERHPEKTRSKIRMQ